MKFFGKIAEWGRKYGDSHNYTCDLCGREVYANERVCAQCAQKLPWNGGAVCPFCGRKVKEEGTCAECKRSPLTVERARSALLYEGEASRLLLRFKRGERWMYRTLAQLSVPALKREFPSVDAIVPVPMTKGARIRRGYDQVRLLCGAFSRALSVPVLRAVEKRRRTKPQKNLSREERQSNVRGCFRVTDRKGVKGKTLLVIDDALTTGATVSEMGRVLKGAGAAHVYAFTVTSVEDKTPFGKP